VAESGTSEQEVISGVSPDEVAHLLQKDLAPIREKVKNRKPSTETEIKRLQTHAQSGIQTKGESAKSAYLASNAVPELIVS
jgi:hypothetical protein